MIVVDASAILDYVMRTQAASSIEARLFAHGDSWHAPHLLDAEVVSVLRRHTLAGALSAGRAEIMLGDFAALRIDRHSHEPLLERIWRMRNNLSAYDATYVALAESLDAPLITRDRRLANAEGSRARVEVF